MTVYRGPNEVTNFYVGKSLDLQGRKREHFKHLRRGRHRNRWLQRAWNKYGETSLHFRILLMANRDDLLRLEQETLDSMRVSYGDSRILNILKECVDTRLGVAHTDATRKQLSERQKANWTDPTYRSNTLAAIKLALNRPEVRAKQSASQKIAQAKPGVRERKRLLAIELGSRPETKARRKAANAKPEVRARRSASIKKALSLPGVKEQRIATQKIAQNRPEVKEKIAATNALPEVRERRRAAVVWQQSEEARQHQREIQLIAQNRPETQLKRSAAVKAALSTAESKANRRVTNSLPEVKARRSAASKAVQARLRAEREATRLDNAD